MYKFIYILLTSLLFTTNVFCLDITETIKNTVENNIKIKIALEQINESKENIASAYGNFKPNITLDLTEKQSSTETKTSTSKTNTSKLADTYSLTVKQNLYNGGRNHLELKKSKILYEKEIENFYLTLNDLILRAIRGYLTVQLYEKSVEVTEKNYQIIKKIYEDTISKKKLGVATLSELKNAESSFENSKSNLLIAEGDLEIGKETFKQIVGLEPINLEEFIDLNYQINKKNIINNAINNNHELNILNFDLEISDIDLEIYKNIKLPSLDVTGDISYNDNVSTKGTETRSGSISATLSIPIYQKGIENSDIRKYQSKLLQSEYKIKDKIDEINLQASILSNQYQIYASQIASSKISIEANKIALEITNKEFESGTKTFTDLINQEEELLNSFLYNINKNNDLLITYFEILALEGKLISKFNEYLPKI